MIVVDTILWLVQMIFAVSEMLLKYITRGTSIAYNKIMIGRRWLKGESLYQKHDHMIGIPDPAALEELAKKSAERKEKAKSFATHARSCDACWPVWLAKFAYEEVDLGSMCEDGKIFANELAL